MATTNSRLSEPANTINVPAFIDTDSCDCRLRPIPDEAAIDSENARAWHCVRHEATSPLQAHFEKWYFPMSEERHSNSISDDEAKGYLLPDTRAWYHATLDEGQPLRLRPSDTHELDLRKERCTGKIRGQKGISTESAKPLLIQRAVRRPSNKRPSEDGTLDDTDNSNTSAEEETLDDRDEETPSNRNSFSNEQPSADDKIPTDKATSDGEELARKTELPADEIPPGEDVDSPEYKYRHSCKRGDEAVAVQIQDNSSWNDVGCLPGFLCK